MRSILNKLYIFIKKMVPFKKEIKYFILKKINKKYYPVILKRMYKKRTGKKLNLENPVTFNEKIQWSKLYDVTPLKTQLADKYLVREWVKEKIGEEYLIPLLGVPPVSG